MSGLHFSAHLRRDCTLPSAYPIHSERFGELAVVGFDHHYSCLDGDSVSRCIDKYLFYTGL